MYKLILLFFVSFFISCSSNDTSDFALDQNLYENNKLEDYELFEKSNTFISRNELDLALKELDKIDVLFPSSSYSKKGLLLSAYIYFLKKDYEKTRALAQNYKKYYPGNENIVYANYLEAMTYYVLIKKPYYSQQNAYLAFDKFNFLINAYPNSIYEVDIITKLKVLDNNIAANKLSTAKFYYNKDNFYAALVYLKDIFQNHNSSIPIQETLYYLTKIYKDIDEIKISKEYAAILAYNFPKSVWYQKSYNLINDIEIEKNKKNWFNRYNPIKIFINDQKEENFEIKKID